MQTPIKRSVVFNPYESEIIEHIMKAACRHFEITEEQLITDTSPRVANIRFLCFWLLAENTSLKDYMIAHAFSKTRTAVNYGVGLIGIHKEIYRQTLDNLHSLAAIANTFERKYSWLLQPISTTN
jgi:hypothetical protein